VAERLPAVPPEELLRLITAFQRLKMPLGPLLPAADDFTTQYISSLKAEAVAPFLAALAHVCPSCRTVCRQVGSVSVVEITSYTPS
jgi:hypothetical protein